VMRDVAAAEARKRRAVGYIMLPAVKFSELTFPSVALRIAGRRRITRIGLHVRAIVTNHTAVCFVLDACNRFDMPFSQGGNCAAASWRCCGRRSTVTLVSVER